MIHLNWHKPNKGRYFKQFIGYLGNLAFWQSKPTTKFVIFAQGRTGSTLLVELLNNHPNIFCDEEILNKKLYGKSLSIMPYLNGKARGCGKQVFGFKVKIYQLIDDQEINPREFIQNLFKNNWKLIFLKRNNLFKHALSGIIAEQTNIWHKLNTNNNNDIPKLEINISYLEQKMAYRYQCLQDEEGILKDIPHLQLEYETDLLQEQTHQAGANKVFNYLGLNSVPVKTTLKRTIDDNLQERISNYDEVLTFLSHYYPKYLN